MPRSSPQQAQRIPVWAGSCRQQKSQIGTRVKRRREPPQRAQEQGNNAHDRPSTGLRSTRTMARQTVVWESGTEGVSETVSPGKTHLTPGRQAPQLPAADGKSI